MRAPLIVIRRKSIDVRCRQKCSREIAVSHQYYANIYNEVQDVHQQTIVVSATGIQTYIETQLLDHSMISRNFDQRKVT
jgi:hypothetical protein